LVLGAIFALITVGHIYGDSADGVYTH